MANTYTIINGHNMKLVDNGDGTFSFTAQTVNPEGSVREFFGSSTDTKPTLSADQKGSTYFEINTTVVSMWDGSAWVVI